MASNRLGPNGRGRSGDTPQSRRTGAYMETSAEEFPPSLSRRARKEAENSRNAILGNAQPKSQSRIPQTPSGRRPSAQGQTPTSRPPLTHQTQSWGSAGSSGSSKSGPKTPSSTTTSSSKSQKGLAAPRNVLRRKQSNISQETTSIRNVSRSESHRTSSSSSIPQSRTSFEPPASTHLDRELTASPAEIRVAQKVELPTTNAHTVIIYPELDRYRDVQVPVASNGPHPEVPFRLATHDLPPPTPLFSGTSSQVSGFSGSPSTRFSESPGPGPYSRDTTPTSISSQSPGLVAPIRIPAARVRQGSPAQTRPPVTRRRAGSVPNEVEGISADPQGLAAVRESLNSSSSNSTVRDVDKKDKKKKKRLSPLPPSPPPRKSSQKFKKSRDEEDSPSKPPRETVQPAMTTRSPAKATTTTKTSRSAPVAAPSKAVAPLRPSRDGTPDLQSQLGLPLPIIHSNLSATSLSERRQSIPLLSSSLPRSTTPSSQSDEPLRSLRPPTARQPTPTLRSTAASDRDRQVQTETGRSVRTPSPSVSSKTKFSLFGRRTKAVSEEPEKKDKPTRKGPAAGTGYEGYGRLGAVRRRSGSASNITRGLSQESLGSNTQTQDPFFTDRMNPVVIAGGEVIENRNPSSELSRTESNQSLILEGPSFASQNSSQISLSSREDPRNTLWPSAFPRGASQASSLGSRRPSDSSDSEALAMKSTLAFRRSVQRLQAPDQPPLRLPKPIVTRSGVSSPSMNSVDTSVMSDDSFYESKPDPARGRKEINSAAPKKLTKRVRSPRRWNFFGRSQSQPATVKTAVAGAPTVAATVKVVQHKPVAFYMMDSSEQEDADQLDVEEVLREAQVLGEPVPSVHPAVVEEKLPISLIKSSANTTGSAPVRISEETPLLQEDRSPMPKPKVSLSDQQTGSVRREPVSQPPVRPSRLPHVGRIPKVVSARPDQASPKSFSRPFNRVSIQTPPPRLDTLDTESVAKGPSPPKPSTPDLTQGSTQTSGRSASPSQPRLSREIFSGEDHGVAGFLTFSPRKNDSQYTSTTTSSSSGIVSYADATAVIPDPHEPLVEDEIWDEYNDLIGDETLKVPPSAGSSQGKPFHLEILGRKLADDVNQKLESPTIAMDTQKSTGNEIDTDDVHYTSSVYSADTAAKLNDALEAGGVPSTPFSVTEFVTGYGDRNNSVSNSTDQAKERTSASSNDRVRRSQASESSNCSQVSDDNSPLSQVNLRVGSMTVSKWLTFGHVLFSPARDDLIAEVGSLKRHSILVVDGLGNDDWSFYAAETYPAATFFNLSPRAPLPAEHQNSSTFPLSPPNHHQIQYVYHTDKIPFGPQSFTSVVYRFPVAAPEAHYRNIVAEARRVLKPGGYIELSILDVDLNNMGNRTRRSVRRLKERIHARAPDVSLGSTSDLIIRLLGRKGFTDIKVCRVGVPVVSTMAHSSGSERGLAGDSKGAGKSREKDKSRRDDRSLAEMMSDESPVADESITKMVSKVGRWWYNRCYETAAVDMGPGNGSMWADRALLSECEEWRTSLKLMVCHARVPPGISRVASI